MGGGAGVGVVDEDIVSTAVMDRCSKNHMRCRSSSVELSDLGEHSGGATLVVFGSCQRAAVCRLRASGSSSASSPPAGSAECTPLSVDKWF